SAPIHSFVFSCARIFAPALRNASLDPLCSRCQSVLKTAPTGWPLKDVSRKRIKSAVRSGRPPLTSNKPSGWLRTTMLPPAPLTSVRLPVSGVAVIGGSLPAANARPQRESPATPPANFFKNSLRVDGMVLQFISKSLLRQAFGFLLRPP